MVYTFTDKGIVDTHPLFHQGLVVLTTYFEHLALREILLVLPKDGNETVAQLARGGRQHLTNGWSALRHQDVVTLEATLPLVSAPFSCQHKLPKAGTAQSEEKTKAQGSVLKQSVQPAKPQRIRQRETRHLNKFVLHTQTSGAVVTDVGHRIPIANACALVLRYRLCSIT